MPPKKKQPHEHRLMRKTITPLLKRWASLYNYSRRFYFFMISLDPRMRLKLFVMQALSIINSLIYLVGTLAIIPFVNYLASPEKTLQNKYISALYEFVTSYTSFNFTIVLGILSVVALLIARTASVGASYFIANINRQLILYYTNKLFTYYICKRDQEIQSDHSAASVTVNITSRMPAILANFVNPVFRLANALVFILAGIVIIVLSSPPVLFLLLMPLFLFLLIGIYFVRKRIISASHSKDRNTRKRMMQTLESLGAKEDIQIMGKEKAFIGAYNQSNQAIAHANFRLGIIGTLFAPISEFLIYTMTVLSVIALIFVTNEVDLSVFTVFLLVLYRMMPRVNELFQIYTGMRAGVIAYDAMSDVLLPALSQKISPSEKSGNPYRIKTGIRMHRISHKYISKQNKQSAALNDVSLEIKAGQKVGICGESGSGKTTLLRILTGSLIPNQGNILIDDISINTEKRLRRWRDSLGYVSQNIFLLNNSIACNIAMEEDATNINQTRLKESLYLAAADEFVAELKQGAQTSLEEAGKNLSGGQRQRLVIARALYYKPRVLILDEATSALDKKTEAIILGRLWDALQNETIIFVTHRIESIRHCDTLFFLKNGRLNAQGAYRQLLKNKEFQQLLGRLQKVEKKTAKKP